MVRAAACVAAAFADVWAGITAVQLFSFLQSLHPDADAFVGERDFQSLLTLAALGALYSAVALVYRRLHQAEAEAGAAAGRRLTSGLVAFVLLAAAGLLEFFLLVQRAGGGGGVDGDAARRALGRAALSTLPAAATATFFWGVMLLIIAHIRAGGEGGGGGGEGAVAGDLQIQQWPVSLLTEIAVGAAAGLVGLMALALYGTMSP
ncbi:hypothetical protein U9M48_029384 [Paspalum notatum var. saurae]|uniref:Uncharacterized protein n=1 Tax=Paspalum notatum var. saurae TaxID=547442 RepID=A0AAQ3X144_PASNO